MTLHELTPAQHRHRFKRVGRGNSSGKGTTAGRGTKGQRARTGGRNKLTRRGLQHLIVRTPKTRGFRSRREKFESVNLEELQRVFADGATITPRALLEQGLIRHLIPGVKILAGGSVTKKFTVKAQKFSVEASAAITKAGGSVTVIAMPSRVVPKKQRT
ncbi:MAG: 50S ribosomal protein L15 [Candidatus Kerfeldbacteria bacterium]|nr:50S ribosomal protein L15 [Candidatus Kerfeldbacteria bacterium]